MRSTILIIGLVLLLVVSSGCVSEETPAETTETKTVSPTTPPPETPNATKEVTEPSPTIQFRSLSTGTFLVKKLSGGYGELTIENGRDLDAVAVLASSREPRIPLLAVYIQSEDSFTIKGIEDGVYTLYFTLGEDWDSDLEKFTRKTTYARFEEELKFETTETATESLLQKAAKKPIFCKMGRCDNLL